MSGTERPGPAPDVAPSERPAKSAPAVPGDAPVRQSARSRRASRGADPGRATARRAPADRTTHPEPARHPEPEPAANHAPANPGAEGPGAEPRSIPDPLQRLPAWGRPWVPPLLAFLTLAAGLIDIVSALTPEWRARLADLRGILPASASRQAAAFTVVVGLLLVLLSRGLRRRKRRAWRGAVVLLAASVVLHVAKGLDYEEATASAALLVILIVTRREFTAKGDPRTRWRALGVGLLLACASVVIGLAMLELRHTRIVGPDSFSDQIQQVLLGLIGIAGPLHFVSDRFADLLTRILLTMGLVTVAVTAYLALRPPEPRPRLTADDEARMRCLLDRFGASDSLGYFALRRDKSVVWSPTGKACVAYRVVSGVMLASGDPLGDNEAWPGAIKAFLNEAAEHAWTPAVIGCSEAGGTAWARAGLSALEFGDEAIVDVAQFTLDGRSMRNVRQAVGRVERAGYSVRAVRMSEVDAVERASLRAQAAAWRGAETERGFSMALGRTGDPADRDCVAVMAFTESPDGRGPVLRGFLHFVPWGTDGLSLDLMLRDKSADNGLNEFLIVAALKCAPDLGIKKVSLNFAFFRSALERGGRLGAGPVIRAWRGLLLFLSRWFQIDSLYRFNAKFQPRWVPRYVCFPSTGDLPRIALAMLEAEAFLVWPQTKLRPALGRMKARGRRRARALRPAGKH